MNRTGIQWTDYSSNPIRMINTVTGRTGWLCSKVSPGCKVCYSERTNLPYGNGLNFSDEGNWSKVRIEVSDRELDAWRRLKTPSCIFIEDMSDLFHPQIPEVMLNRVFDGMDTADWHSFQILTKRPDRMSRYLLARYGMRIPRQFWVGTSVEMRMYLPRIEHLKDLNASVRFVSFEPLLGSLMGGTTYTLDDALEGIQWAITGGESDFHDPRPADLEWFREIKAACARHNVAFFYKQQGGSSKCQCCHAWGCGMLDGFKYHNMPVVREPKNL